ncbi:MAG: hypothetical protein J6R80_00710 [Kiritimatiellae bacterium]|jgi:hypothetical protein|nr:hypothetical protein [Kiritimatiellia bacterium]
MRKPFSFCAAALWALALVVFSGCGANYSWRSNVPAAMRTVTVPTFRNESDTQEAGAIAARQVLREIQREGTFKIKAQGEAALEVQGTIVSLETGGGAFDRRAGLRISGHEIVAQANVSIIDKMNGKVLVESKLYSARTTSTSAQDGTTARRDATGRVMEDLARQIVDDLLGLNFGKEGAK